MSDVVKEVDAGLAIITNLMKGAGTEPKWIGIGTGTTPAANGDTALETPSGEARAVGTSTRQTTNVSNDTYRVVGTITKESAAADIAEAGTFDALTNGNMGVHATFGAIHLEVGNGLELTFDSVFDQA